MQPSLTEVLLWSGGGPCVPAFSPQIWGWVVLRTFGEISGHSHGRLWVCRKAELQCACAGAHHPEKLFPPTVLTQLLGMGIGRVERWGWENEVVVPCKGGSPITPYVEGGNGA